MKAYQVVENGKPLEERDLETPTPQGNEVLLKTVACGVCHSEKAALVFDAFKMLAR